MEVHHTHHPTHKKNWKEYFLEFFMLFFAVTLGFFAENIRESIMENEREEVFMQSMWEDLRVDTSRINYSIERLQKNINATDSLIFYIDSKMIDKNNSKSVAKYALGSGYSVDVVFNDRTSSQLKGTGSFRLIKNKEIADSLMVYWNNQIKLDQIHKRYEDTRQRQKEIGFQTFFWYPSYYEFASGNSFNKHQDVDFIINRENLIQFANATSSMYNIAKMQYLKELMNQKQLAIRLIEKIHNSYLKNHH